MVCLAGDYNLRDLGGCRTGNGREVRTGLVFRSAALTGMIAPSLEALAAHNVRLVIDLRSDEERGRAPGNHAIETWSRAYSHSAAGRSTPHRPDMTAREATDRMLDTYRRLPDDHAGSYAELFGRIALGQLPILFHCSAGKDRTGVGAALLLDLLGVPRPAIERDFLSSLASARRAAEETRRYFEASGIFLEEDVLRPFVDVTPHYLAAAFSSIEQRFGDTETYRRQKLGIGDDAEIAIRANLLA